MNFAQFYAYAKLDIEIDSINYQAIKISNIFENFITRFKIQMKTIFGYFSLKWKTITCYDMFADRRCKPFSRYSNG